ncbi:MAG: hypothetical protein A3F12_06145 [Gammaproteobacteria bacterium RIFCSPHIGHO2_12_FULL_38_14]|nr:MAG: hypothetical protein A3F12_06145 [Gammaproteobacteria bacterium RIFCSPHIGHO2_12_FULL_38_14]
MNLMSMKIKEKGATVIEFAILLPVFIMLIMGAIEIGWALYVQHALVDAARVGARIAVTQQVSEESIRTDVIEYIQNSSINGTPTITFMPSPVSEQSSGSLITVTIDLPFNSATILPTPLFLQDKILSAQSSMAKEY